MPRRRTFVEAVSQSPALRGRRAEAERRLTIARAENIAPALPSAAMLAYSRVMDQYTSRVERLVERLVVRRLGDASAVRLGLAELEAEMLAMAGKLRRNARAAAKRAGDHARGEVGRLMDMKVPRDPRVGWLEEDFAARNVDLVRRLASAQVRKLEAVIAAHEDGDLAEKLRSATWVARNRSHLIARDQVYKFQAEQISYWATAVGSEGFMWVTRLDDRVRATHRAQHGRTFAWGQAPLGGPGGEPNCRCVAVPVESALLVL